jgi:uncharacterized protein (TIGR02147 family)
MVASAEIVRCTDTREALKLLLVRLKSLGKPGLRDLAGMAGLRSPASMSMILKGQRRLSVDSAERLARAFKLDKKSSRYLSLLTRRDLCERYEERLELEERLLYLRTRGESHAMELTQYRFLAVWYYPILYALASDGKLKFEAERIAKRIRRGVTSQMVRTGVGDLVNLGLLKLENGFLKQSLGPICTNERVRHLAIRRYHSEMIRLAAESVALSPTERELNGLTARIPMALLPQIKRRMSEFREEINELLTGATEGEVFQMNLQLFPMTQSEPDGEARSG